MLRRGLSGDPLRHRVHTRLWWFNGLVIAVAKSPPKQLSRRVLQSEGRTKEHAAWLLMLALEELLPDRIEKLVSITRGLHTDTASLKALFEPFSLDRSDTKKWIQARVNEWCETNNIACEAVEHAAACWAVGFSGPSILDIGGIADKDGAEIDTPTLTADPHNESKDEFLKRAADYYDRVVHFFGGSSKLKVVKRELSHFRYLVAHVVGGCSFAQIADGENPFKLAAKSAKTVAGECRKLAALIGVPMPSTPGPRPGRSIRKATLRVSR